MKKELKLPDYTQDRIKIYKMKQVREREEGGRGSREGERERERVHVDRSE